MADFSSAFWTERAIGASAGAAVSLVYMLPADRREAACRFLAGVISGMDSGAAAPLANTATVSFVLISPSTEMELNERSEARLSAA